MEFRLLNNNEIIKWYNNELINTFQEDEITPLNDILNRIKNNKYEIYGLLNKNELIGYASLLKNNKIPVSLLDYLGVSKKYRNNGYGSIILNYLKSMKLNIIVENESILENDTKEEKEIKIRRINFYKRNNFIYKYNNAACGIIFNTLYYGENIEINKLQQYHKSLYDSDRLDVVVPIENNIKPPIPSWHK